MTTATVAVGALLSAVALAPARANIPAPTGTATQTVTRNPQPTPRLTDIRTGRHPSYDRIVLDLRGAAPGYTIGYVRTVRRDGSGQLVDLRGNANLLVRLRPAAAHRADGTATYTGPRRFHPGLPQIRDVALVGDFEGTVSVALGIAHKAGFRVLTLANPTRVVVDIAH